MIRREPQSNVIDLRHYRTDRAYLSRMTSIRFMSVNDVWLNIWLETSSTLSLAWLETLEWQVRHVQSGRTARAGRFGRPLLRIVSLFDNGRIYKIAPLYPSLGHIPMDDLFRLDVRTLTGQRRFFFNTPCSPEQTVEE